MCLSTHTLLLINVCTGSQQHGLKHVHHLHAVQLSGVALVMLLASVTGVSYDQTTAVYSSWTLLLYAALC
jgi:hypothetical protein